MADKKVILGNINNNEATTAVSSVCSSKIVQQSKRYQGYADISGYPSNIDYIKIPKEVIDNLGDKNFVSHNYNAKLPGSFCSTVINYYGVHYKELHITKVLYNDPVTVVWWSDGTVTKNRCPEGVTYNPDTGLLFCITNKLFDRNCMANIFNNWSLDENEENYKNRYITLKDVRKKVK